MAKSGETATKRKASQRNSELKASATPKPKTIAVSLDNIEAVKGKLHLARSEADLSGRQQVVEILDDVLKDIDALFFTPARDELI